MRWAKYAARKTGGYWRCRIKHREANRLFDKSEKGRARAQRKEKTEKAKARRERYAKSEKGRATNEHYAASRIQVQIAGLRSSYRVPPERRDELLSLLSEHRAGQWAEYREEFA